MLATRGLGPSCLLCTAGLGPYLAYVVPVEPTGPTGGGAKKQFEPYSVVPRRIWLRTKVGEPTLRLAEVTREKAEEILQEVTEVVIEGEVYKVSAAKPPTPSMALKLLPEEVLAAKIALAKKELGITKREVMKALRERAAKEIEAAELFKLSLVREDEELALIIIMAEI